MGKTVFERLRDGDAVDMRSPEYGEAISHMAKTRALCHRANQIGPDLEATRPIINEIFNEPIDETTFISTPFEIDFGCQMTLGKGVFINHSLTVMSAGGVTIGEGTMIGPNVSLLTDNHDMTDKMILICKSINIGKNVWIGAGAMILPGVTISDNAVVGAGAVVTKDVESDTVVAGVPAKFIRHI